MSSHNPTDLTVISFMSGKGGVGKTMLAVAAAHELSATSATLIVDLDFFNRGLSGLLLKGERLGNPYQDAIPVHAPSFLNREDESSWSIRKIGPKLFTLDYPDVPERTITNLVNASVEDLSEALSGWIRKLSEKLQCSAIILDCHGGPDPLSFAAAHVSDCVLLVSEPDRVTMYGTLHFLRRLSEFNTDISKVHLVFNKVVDSFSSAFLKRTYDTNLRDYFGGKPLLASFPLEVYLTKYFEHHPFVTAHFPESMLSRKTEVMLLDLLSDGREQLVSEKARNLPKLFAYWWRSSFGRTPRILQLDFVMVLSFIVLLVVFAAFLQEKFFTRQPIFGAPEMLVIIIVALWAAFTTLLSWTWGLDRELTLSSRTGRWFAFSWYVALLTFVWAISIATLAQWIPNLLRLTIDYTPMLYVCYLALCVIAVVWVGQLYRAFRDFKYRRFLVEPMTRSGLAVLILIGSGIAVNALQFRDDPIEIDLAGVSGESLTLFRSPRIRGIFDAAEVAGEVEELRMGAPPAYKVSSGGFDWYSFVVTGASDYVITVVSYDGDPTVALYASDLEYISEDDDGGQGLDSRLEGCVEAGRYYVGVRDLLGASWRYSIDLTLERREVDGTQAEEVSTMEGTMLSDRNGEDGCRERWER